MEHAIHRYPDRASDDRDLLDALLDEVWWGVLCLVADGEPWAIPLLHARDGDRLLLHGSTGAGVLRRAAAGAPVVYTVVVMDALVVGHTTFDSSANYRSATVRGVCRVVPDGEKPAVLERFSEAILPGRSGEVRPPNPREMAATLALSLPLAGGTWLYKARAGGASLPDEETDAWAGVVPVPHGFGAPQRAEWSVADLPRSVRALTERAGGRAG